MLTAILTTAALTAKMASTAAAGQRIMDKQAEVQREREARDTKR